MDMSETEGSMLDMASARVQITRLAKQRWAEAQQKPYTGSDCPFFVHKYASSSLRESTLWVLHFHRFQQLIFQPITESLATMKYYGPSKTSMMIFTLSNSIVKYETQTAGIFS
jgi:hypothetical protein